MLQIQKKLAPVVIVTGSSSGLGLQITSQILDQTNYRVVCISRHCSADLAILTEKYPKRCVYYGFDFAKTEDIASLVKTVREREGPIFGLVNNAAIGLDGILATQHNSDISSLLKINLEAPIVLTKYVCRDMLRHGVGRIVNISSIIASTGFNGLSVYAASKAGLEGFSKSLSRELGKQGVTVNCVAPGYMLTQMTREIDEDRLDAISRRAPLGLATPEKVATGVLYFLSDSAYQCTGTVLTYDGGSTA